MIEQSVKRRMRVFLDANILFSAPYSDQSGMRKLWLLPDITLVTSVYAIEEAGRNLTTEPQKIDLQSFVSRTEVDNCGNPSPDLFIEIDNLPEKDRPILWAAIETRCTHLITGDKRHFGELYDTEVCGVRIMRARDLIRLCESKKLNSD